MSNTGNEFKQNLLVKSWNGPKYNHTPLSRSKILKVIEGFQKSINAELKKAESFGNNLEAITLLGELEGLELIILMLSDGYIENLQFDEITKDSGAV